VHPGSGGIGYTWEHPAHRYYRRALSLRACSARPRVGPPGRRAGPRRRPQAVRSILPEDAEPRCTGIQAELAGDRRAGALARTAGLALRRLGRPAPARAPGAGRPPLEQLVIAEEMKQAGLRARPC
jgi:alkylation response protein AidB-like acyl-CoA dehydrogenase